MSNFFYTGNLFWVLFATIVVTFLAMECGFRSGRYQNRKEKKDSNPHIGAVVSAILGLLAFMLAFTFGSASSRLEARKQHLMEDANTMGTAYLRIDLLTKSQAEVLQPLLKEYIDIHSKKATSKETVLKLLDQSNEIQKIIWQKATQYMQENPDSLAISLFIQSLNIMFDASSKRADIILHSKIPPTIWLSLYLLSILAMFTMGYHAGHSKERRSIAFLLLTVSFSIVLFLIVDLDRGFQGHFKTNRYVLSELQKSISE
ncbi:MAG: hypothetical protein KAR01_11280 [Desulfocapsa sp.]|nr:hypothetical protein [Desulfocapsa sp.]